MNKFVFGALAACSASTLGFAGSTDGDWSSLDREIENLSSTLSTAAGPGPHISGILRVYALWADQDVFAGATDDVLGVVVDTARLVLEGDVGAGYGYYLALDINDGLGPNVLVNTVSVPSTDTSVDMVDAYGTFKIGDMVKGTFGRFRPGFIWSGAINENGLLFKWRTVNGSISSVRDEGLMLSGNFDQFGVWLTAANGSDSLDDDLLLAGRVAFNAMGKGVGLQEGAYGAPEEVCLTVGFGAFDDGNLSDGSAWGADAEMTMGQFYLQGEFADYGDDLFFAIADAQPWSLTASYLIKPGEWELAARFEQWDDSDDTEHWVLGVNWYVNGLNAKWSAEYDYFKSDNAPLDGGAVLVGLTLGI